ncbi:MAG: STAS domain-containing protein [Alphaproteobacteria bacterium]|nr:STAS domain-containing protein [Alphaproteobacteria bacterium]
MLYDIKLKESNAILNIHGQLNLANRDVFTSSVLDIFKSEIKLLIVDMEDVKHIDSVGMGTLLIIRQQAQKRNVNISIINLNKEIKDILKQACFDTLFDIH